MAHSIRFSSLSVFRTNYIVPGMFFFSLPFTVDFVYFFRFVRSFFRMCAFFQYEWVYKMKSSALQCWASLAHIKWIHFHFIFLYFASYAQEINTDDISRNKIYGRVRPFHSILPVRYWMSPCSLHNCFKSFLQMRCIGDVCRKHQCILCIVDDARWYVFILWFSSRRDRWVSWNKYSLPCEILIRTSQKYVQCTQMRNTISRKYYLMHMLRYELMACKAIR